jgi:uncharacterized membrane protein affecting hemolysin expression
MKILLTLCVVAVVGTVYASLLLEERRRRRKPVDKCLRRFARHNPRFLL